MRVHSGNHVVQSGGDQGGRAASGGSGDRDLWCGRRPLVPGVQDWLEIKPQRKRSTLARRSDAELSWVDEAPDAGSPILLDTTVYIDVLQGRTSVRLDDFISLRTCNHSSVCVCELTHAYGRLRPEDERISGTLRVIGKTIRDIPAHRLSAPDSDTWGRAGMLAGVLFRLGDYPDGEQRKCLNDALVYVQARKLGWPVVTRNVKEFDFLNQLVPDGRVLPYRNVS